MHGAARGKRKRRGAQYRVVALNPRAQGRDGASVAAIVAYFAGVALAKSPAR